MNRENSEIKILSILSGNNENLDKQEFCESA